MGDYYDFSELPTVVYHDNKPVVYDGNRRVILGKIKLGYVNVSNSKNIVLPKFPEKIPCNICIRDIALKNVYRKHNDSGSWQPLERDIFLHKFMGKEKSAFLILEENTGIVSANPNLNQRFVKDEIFKEDALKSMGFIINNGKLTSIHNDSEAYSILLDITKKVERKEITTRKNRGKVIDVLEESNQKIIDKNKDNAFSSSKINFNHSVEQNNLPRQTRRVSNVENVLFGGKLYLSAGEINNLYKDIVDLNQFYLDKKTELSQSFPGLIRMSLRLLCETAAKESRSKFGNYLKKHFENAKNKLDQDTKTTLSNLNITESSIEQLLHTGAHSYTSAGNMAQTIALSIIIGAILKISFGKEERIK